MKSAALASAPALVLSPGRFADYATLIKPRISLLVLFTVATGVLLAGGRTVDPWLLINTLLGTALVAAGASALNQWLEKDSDANMRRTADRPLPAGRLAPAEVLVLGCLLGVIGVAYLSITLSRPSAAALAALTFLIYVGVYTPLKSRTSLNTLVGAVPGALPPVIGWAAVRGTIDSEAVALFLILFLWQVPHFLAIAWMYRDEYARAGLRMLPTVDPDGQQTGQQMVVYCLTLVPASLLPALLGNAGPLYSVGAVALGLFFLAFAVAFRHRHSHASARRMLRASLVYLPGLLALLVIDAALPWNGSSWMGIR